MSECGIGGTDSLERTFNYDPLYRILNANGRENSPTITPIWDDRYRSSDNTTTTAYTQHFTYDRLGNIQKLQHIGNNNFTRNFSYSTTDNKLNSIDVGMTNYAFTYDACGNQIQETASRHCEWDAFNQMRCFYVDDGSGNITKYTQYLYDASGNRVKKITWKPASDYDSISYIDGVFEFRTDGTDEQNLLHIMDNMSRIAMIRLGDDFGDSTPAIQYNLEDHLGSSVVLLETNAANISREEYYAFGETSFGSYAKKRYKYSGKERDEESGMYYYGARYYSAWTCRFTSVDPKSTEFMNWSPYNFVNDNPLVFVDLDGKAPEWVPEISIENVKQTDGKVIKIGFLSIKQEEGDDAESLSKFLNITIDEAEQLFETLDSKGVLKLPDSIANPINMQINDYLHNPGIYDSFIYDNFNCWNSCIAISQNQMPSNLGKNDPANKLYDTGIEFTRTLINTDLYKNVSGNREEIKFGHTLIRFAEERYSIVSGNYNVTTHGATFLGQSRNGTVYVWTKNGWTEKPKIAKLSEIVNMYGKIQGGGTAKNEGGYYNYIGP